MGQVTAPYEPGDVVMVFNDHGNAFQSFPYTPEALEEEARRLRAESSGGVGNREHLSSAKAAADPGPGCGCDRHPDPWTTPWSAWGPVATGTPSRFGSITVAKSNGSHLTESDVQWVRNRLNASELGPLAPLREFARWIAAMDAETGSEDGLEARRSVTLTRIIDRAKRALQASYE